MSAAEQVDLPLDNPFAAPRLPALRGTGRQIAFASRIRDDEILTCRSIWAALDRTQGWHAVGVRAARARHFAAWAEGLRRGIVALPDDTRHELADELLADLATGKAVVYVSQPWGRLPALSEREVPGDQEIHRSLAGWVAAWCRARGVQAMSLDSSIVVRVRAFFVAAFAAPAKV